MSLKAITTQFTRLYEKRIGDFHFIIRKSIDDELYEIEKRKIAPPFSGSTLWGVEFLSKEKYQKFVSELGD